MGVFRFCGAVAVACFVAVCAAHGQQPSRPLDWRSAAGSPAPSSPQPNRQSAPPAPVAPGMASFSPRQPGGMPPFAALQITWTPQQSLVQHRLLTTALQGVQPQRPAKWMSMCWQSACGATMCFESEAAGAADVLSRKYGAQGRTIVLSNGGGPVANRFPAATPAFFTAALARLGEVMDKEEDLLSSS